ncbi:MAG: septum formation initiator family protein [Vulcanimicrobiota bacterium]
MSDNEQMKNKKEFKGPKEVNLGFLLAVLFVCIVIPIATHFYNLAQVKKAEHGNILKEEKVIQVEVNRLEIEKKKMEEERDYLKTPRGIEEIARNKLGLIKKKEIPIIIDEKDELDTKDSIKTKEKSKQK